MTDPIRPPAGGVDPETNMVTPPVPGPYAPAEPVLTAATVVTIATAIMALLVAFAVPLDADQQAAILGAIAVIAPVVLGIVARRGAWSPQTVGQTVRAEVAKAVREVQAEQPPSGRQPGEWLGR